jgi:hypothetical protein
VVIPNPGIIPTPTHRIRRPPIESGIRPDSDDFDSSPTHCLVTNPLSGDRQNTADPPFVHGQTIQQFTGMVPKLHPILVMAPARWQINPDVPFTIRDSDCGARAKASQHLSVPPFNLISKT